jgi:hypothetical protein
VEQELWLAEMLRNVEVSDLEKGRSNRSNTSFHREDSWQEDAIKRAIPYAMRNYIQCAFVCRI